MVKFADIVAYPVLHMEKVDPSIFYVFLHHFSTIAKQLVLTHCVAKRRQTFYLNILLMIV